MSATGLVFGALEESPISDCPSIHFYKISGVLMISLTGVGVNGITVGVSGLTGGLGGGLIVGVFGGGAVLAGVGVFTGVGLGTGVFVRGN